MVALWQVRFKETDTKTIIIFLKDYTRIYLKKSSRTWKLTYLAEVLLIPSSNNHLSLEKTIAFLSIVIPLSIFWVSLESLFVYSL